MRMVGWLIKHIGHIESTYRAHREYTRVAQGAGFVTEVFQVIINNSPMVLKNTVD